MVNYEQASLLLGEIIDEYPYELMEKLSGGVILKEEQKLHQKSRPERPLYIMGEYHMDGTGKYIVIYYGSFAKVYGRYTEEAFKEKLRHTFAHEMRHHIEHMAGVNTLNIFDDARMSLYDSGMDIAEFKEPPVE